MVKETALALVDSALLKPIGTTSLPALLAFNAEEKFQLGTTDGVKIWGVGPNFKTHFLDKKEKDAPAVELRIHQLRRSSKDPSIIKALGGIKIVETTLGQMWEMVKKQGTGQTGDLLVNGWANIFYIKDDDGILWAVRCRWRGSGWGVEARSVSDPDDWTAGSRVFSR